MGQVTFRTNGQTLVLSGATNPAGTTVGVWSDAGLSAAVTLPATLTADTTYYLRDGDTTITVTQPDGTTVFSSPVAVGSWPREVTPLPTVAQLAAEGGIVGPSVIVPPASNFGTTAASPWIAANQWIVHRFYLPVTTTLRYVGIVVGTQSGNVQVGVQRLSGTNYLTATRVMNSGSVACPATGYQRIDCTATTLYPGEYGVFFWCDNTTATFPHINATSTPGVKWSASQNAASGVQASETIASWSGARTLAGLCVEGDYS